MARCPGASASGPWPKHGPHQDWRISPPTRAEDLGDRLAVEARVGLLDLPADAARAREDRERARDLAEAELARGVQHERGREQVVVAAVGAGADHGLVEGQPLARDLLGGERVAGRERLGDHRRDLRERERLVDRVDGVGAGRDPRVRQIGDALGAVPRLGDVVRRRRCRSAPRPPPSCWRSCCGRRSAAACRRRRTRPTCPATASRPSGAAARARCPCRETQGWSFPREDDAALLREREVDVARRPAEAERRRAHAEADRAVGAVRAAVRVGARDELARHHEALLGKVEVEDAVARSRVVRLLHPVEARELAADRGLAVVVLAAREDEVVVGDGGLARDRSRCRR